MAKTKQLNKKGFGYIVAIGMLALLAFMGLFLLQSSSVEYSQTSMSVYRTMGRQIAESAANEAAVLLQDLFKDKSDKGYFMAFLNQAASSGDIKSGGETGKLPSLKDDFNNLKDKAGLTEYLVNHHITKAGFVIEKILPTIKDLRPIPDRMINFDTDYHRPTDRATAFDNEFSRDWYCTLQIDVTVALEKNRKSKINYKLCKDIKMLNLGPIARNYSYYSVLGVPIKNYNDKNYVMSAIETHINPTSETDSGKLILWNMPFHSRVFVHGPAIIDLENTNLLNDDYAESAYGTQEKGPGANMAYQYSSTFCGLSYFDVEKRCFWEEKLVANYDRIEDEESTLKNNYGGYLGDVTTAISGFYPLKDSNKLKQFLNDYGFSMTQGYRPEIQVGTKTHQKFLPGGIFCSTPWRYIAKDVAGAQPSGYRPNQLDQTQEYKFPKDDPQLRIEHRWNPDDDSIAESTMIYSKTKDISYGSMIPNIDIAFIHSHKMKEVEDSYQEFGLNYTNRKVLNWAQKILSGIVTVGKVIFNKATLPIQIVGKFAFSKISSIWKKDTLVGDKAGEEGFFTNLYPTNLKFDYERAVTRRLKDETEIPKDENKRWILNGVYLMDSLNIDGDVEYIGKGTIIYDKYDYEKRNPLTIRGNIVAARDSNKRPLGYLNLFYSPLSDGHFSEDVNSDKLYERMLVIDKASKSDGEGITIEASVYSLCGVRCLTGANISTDPNSEYFYSNLGIDPSKPFSTWAGFTASDKFINNFNIINGNLINSYMTFFVGNNPNNDLWVIHNPKNTFFFEEVNGAFYSVQDILDYDQNNNRLRFEKKTHEFFMSPKIQHIGIKGGI